MFPFSLSIPQGSAPCKIKVAHFPCQRYNIGKQAGRQGTNMLLVKDEKVRAWLAVINRSQTWLAQQVGVKRSFISQVLCNKTKIPPKFIEKILLLMHCKFEDVFIVDGAPDKREFYAGQVYYNGEMLKTADYRKKIVDKVR